MEPPEYSEALAGKLRRQLLDDLQTERRSLPAHLFGHPRLQRFVQGNGGDVQDALTHFRRMLAWREEAKMATRRVAVAGKSWSPGHVPGLRPLLEMMAVDCESFSPDGHMLWVQCDGKAQLGRLMELSERDLFNTFFLLCELRQDALDAMTEERGHLCQVWQIRDLSGFSVAGLIRNRAMMGRLQEVLRISNLGYPEMVKRVVLLNVPATFNLLWTVLQPLLNSRIQRKFVFLGKGDQIADLFEMVGTCGLEALARCRKQSVPQADPTVREVQAGCSEYTCIKVRLDDSAHWSFACPGAGLNFGAQFFPEGGVAPRNVRESSLVTGCCAGAFKAPADGLVWLTWANSGTFSRLKRVQGLSFGVVSQPAGGTASRVQGSTARAEQDGGGSPECRRRSPLGRECSCFGGWILPSSPVGRRPDKAPSRRGAEREGPSGAVGAVAAAPFSESNRAGASRAVKRPGSPEGHHWALAMLLAAALFIAVIHRLAISFEEQMASAIALA